MPKFLSSNCKEMVASLMTYFEKERDHGGPVIPITSVRDRVAEALKISVSTVNHIAAEVNRGEILKSPPKKRKRTKPVVDIDEFDQNAFRNAVYDMYKNKEHITLRTLKDKLQSEELFFGCETSLWKILQKIGFKYRKDDPRRGLMELPTVVMKRVRFLHDYVKLKNQDLYQFVFMDETWIFKDGTIGRSWQDSDTKSVKKTKVGGARYIIVHAGCTSGFIPGAELVFSSTTHQMDYHGEMNAKNFLHWFEHKLLVNLERPSVIVLDNASYHSSILNKAPTMASKKEDIKVWLTTNNILFEPTFLKLQLLELVKQNKRPVEYETDLLAEKYGHRVLRLPPYHCIFNPIEHIWGITKNYYRDHVGTDGSSREKSLAIWKEALGKVTVEVWAETIRHTEELIQLWWDRE